MIFRLFPFFKFSFGFNILGLALAGGAGLLGFLGQKSANSKAKSLAQNKVSLKPFDGPRPPGVKFLRPVEKQITDILLRRSRGEDVGFDPRRREALLENFDIDQGRRQDEREGDIQNFISGAGLSRNVAAREALLGRTQREFDRERNLFRNRVDIEDLTRANEERDINTARLQNQNVFNFGQENTRADFALRENELENQRLLNEAGFNAGIDQAIQGQQSSPLGAGIQSALGVAGQFANPSSFALNKSSSGGPTFTRSAFDTNSLFSTPITKSGPKALALAQLLSKRGLNLGGA